MTAPPTKAEEIAQVLEEAILAGELAPGSVLRQEQLSEQFGVSRMPIREALGKLAALDLVSFAGKRGVQVRPLARDELFETFAVRAALEGFAAKLAVDRITRSEIREMRRAEKRFAQLTGVLRDAKADGREIRQVASDWVEANAQFHDVYLQAAGVEKLAEAARTATRVFRAQGLWSWGPEMNELYSSNIAQHEAISAAFENKDPSVRDLVENHILDSGRLLEKAMEQAGYGRQTPLSRRVSWAAGGAASSARTP